MLVMWLCSALHYAHYYQSCLSANYKELAKISSIQTEAEELQPKLLTKLYSNILFILYSLNPKHKSTTIPLKQRFLNLRFRLMLLMHVL